MSFACASASASSAAVRIATTGPKISSRHSCISGVTPASTIGGTSRPRIASREPCIISAPFATASSTSVRTFVTAASSTSGPIATPSSSPRPHTSFFVSAIILSVNALAIGRSRMNRFAATQLCPALRNFAIIAWVMATSRSASASTTSGALPPSSSDMRLRSSAPAFASAMPTLVEPVKLILRIARDARNRSPTRRASWLGTTLTTPAGTPTCSAIWASASADSGVCCAGFAMIGQPAASAAPSLRVSIAYGKFHGVISAHGPTGSRVITMRVSARLAGMVSP